MQCIPEAWPNAVAECVGLTKPAFAGTLTGLMNKDLRPNTYLLGLLLT
jgi:hypothetical protein